MAATLLALTASVGAQHSKPVPDNTHLGRNKFKQRDVSGAPPDASLIMCATPRLAAVARRRRGGRTCTCGGWVLGHVP